MGKGSLALSLEKDITFFLGRRCPLVYRGPRYSSVSLEPTNGSRRISRAGLDAGSAPHLCSAARHSQELQTPGQLETSFIFVFPKTRQEKLWIMLERVKVSPFLKGQWARPDGCLMKLFWFLRPVWLGAICWVSIGQGHREAPALGAAILHQDNDGF